MPTTERVFLDADAKTDVAEMTAPTGRSYEQRVHPQRVKLLDLLDMNASYTEGRGEVLQRADGHPSKASESGLGMRAGLATLDVLEAEQPETHALSLAARAVRI